MCEKSRHLTPPHMWCKSSRIILIGMTGVGKTTIGRQLASLLDRSFFDSDEEILRLSGSSVGDLFSMQGAEYFRRLECGVIADLSLRQGVVLATGGGAILCPTVRELLHNRGIVVYLRASLGALHARLAHQTSRPILQSTDLALLLAQRQQEREHMYIEIADLIIDCNQTTISSTSQKIVADLCKLIKNIRTVR